MNSISDQLVIGISTYERWGDLLKTLANVRIFFGYDVRVVVSVDGGVIPVDVRARLAALSVNLLESRERRGYIYHRNRMAFEASERYYMSLDDDSYVISGDMEKALTYLDENKDVGVLAFPIRRLNGDWQLPSSREIPYQARSYIGCGHILRVADFRRLGGYDEGLVHQGEELHYSALLLKHGLKCMHYPGIVVVHEVSQAGRSFDRMRFYTARNKTLWAYDYSPSILLFAIKMLRCCAEQIALSISERRIARIKGIVDGSWFILSKRRARNPLNLVAFRLWNSLSF